MQTDLLKRDGFESILCIRSKRALFSLSIWLHLSKTIRCFLEPFEEFIVRFALGRLSIQGFTSLSAFLNLTFSFFSKSFS
ncbi:unnamed protein product [Blepharisma stoltei]|uniref:Uncharacterized protein n=1 Tax=Blepharisma stoltei TaxID=1481888 RepID=A0AAU9JXD3_9CILI|nr:unnamed protein product [Blepharisma stoltei]